MENIQYNDLVSPMKLSDNLPILPKKITRALLITQQNVDILDGFCHLNRDRYIKKNEKQLEDEINFRYNQTLKTEPSTNIHRFVRNCQNFETRRITFIKNKHNFHFKSISNTNFDFKNMKKLYFSPKQKKSSTLYNPLSTRKSINITTNESNGLKDKIYKKLEKFDSDCKVLNTDFNLIKMHSRRLSNKMRSSKLKLIENEEIEELRMDKESLCQKPINIRIKTRQVMQESDCIKKISTQLVYEAHKSINSIFLKKNNLNALQKYSFTEHEMSNKKIKLNIEKLQDAIHSNTIEKKKFNLKYKLYMDKNKGK